MQLGVSSGIVAEGVCEELDDYTVWANLQKAGYKGRNDSRESGNGTSQDGDSGGLKSREAGQVRGDSLQHNPGAAQRNGGAEATDES